MPRLVIPKHALLQCRDRIRLPINLRKVITPFLGRLEAQVPSRGRVAWMDAPGEMVPVFERASRHGALVLVTILGKGYGLSQATTPMRLSDGLDNHRDVLVDQTKTSS